MKRVIAIAFVAVFLAACGGDAPQVKNRHSQPYIVLASFADPAANALTVSIRVDPPVTEENVKTAADLVIENNKAQFKNITVKSFAVSDASGFPYGTSTYIQGNLTSHHFNPQAAPQKIPTH